MSQAMIFLLYCRATTMNLNKEKQLVGQRQKLLFEMESELTEEFFQKLSGEPLNRFPPRGFIEQRGVITCRNARCLKLSVRQRKRSFSLGGVCDPVFYFPSWGLTIK